MTTVSFRVYPTLALKGLNYHKNDKIDYINKKTENPFSDPKNKLALKNEKIFAWYVDHDQKSYDPEAGWMDQAKEYLKRFEEMFYVQACRNTNPQVVRIN